MSEQKRWKTKCIECGKTYRTKHYLCPTFRVNKVLCKKCITIENIREDCAYCGASLTHERKDNFSAECCCEMCFWDEEDAREYTDV